jgi:cytochrome c oxidase subunit 4
MAEHIVGAKTYVIVWIVLLCLTALTAGLSTIDLDWHYTWNGNPHQIPFNTVLAVVIAATKATIIALIFMHMKYAERVTQVVGIAALFWLGIMFVLTATDFFTRYFGTFAPQ